VCQDPTPSSTASDRPVTDVGTSRPGQGRARAGDGCAVADLTAVVPAPAHHASIAAKRARVLAPGLHRDRVGQAAHEGRYDAVHGRAIAELPGTVFPQHETLPSRWRAQV
jgi:hypothetical protein